MSASLRRPRRASTPARLAALMLTAGLLAAGCSGETETAPEPSADGPVASDGGDDTTVESSDGGGKSVAEVPAEDEPIEVTPAPSDFSLPGGSCTGEGMHLVEPDGEATPALEERDGVTLSIGVESIEKDSVELTATMDDGQPRPIEAAKVGDTIQIDLWTLSVTSICQDLDQVEFDVIN